MVLNTIKTVVFVIVTVLIGRTSGSKTINDAVMRNRLENIVDNKLEEIIQIFEGNQVHLLKKVEELERQVLVMEEMLASQNKHISALKATNEELLSGVLSNNQIRHDADNTHMGKSIGEMTHSSMDVPTSYPKSADRNRRAVGQIAFTAYLSQTNEHTVVGKPIIFDKVLLNDGSGYNNNTGVFTAPLTGTYLFSFHFDTKKLTFIRLVVNGVNQVDAVANPHTGATGRAAHSMGGNTAIVHIGHGDAVMVQTYEVPDGETDSGELFRLCTFSGVLLY
jgi:hypothetical protein